MSHFMKCCTSDRKALGLVAQQLTSLILFWAQLNGVIPLRSLQRRILLVEQKDTAVHTHSL